MPTIQYLLSMKVELLAPAANLEYGIAAIRAGADAVYVGGPGFGARRSAGVSVDDIATLVEYAHGFGARVYVAMNTILMDDELGAARTQALALAEVGVDALIVQDMAYRMMELPIALHASTQAFCLTPQRVKFLQEAGFARVILERGASLGQIREIRQSTEVELEAFVHGAICVSYSGQCYLGHAVCGRGGNRGACAQACRSNYNLENMRGDRLISNVPLLSPKDLNLSDQLGILVEAGVCSLKIEGRLKELDYVVNVVAYYNLMLEQMMVERTSDGISVPNFEPEPAKSFNRGFTNYMFDGPQVGLGTGAATRSIGVRIGTVVSVAADYAVVTGAAGVLAAGDGVCFIDAKGQNSGTQVNRVESEKVYFNSMEGIAKGVTIFCNRDNDFRPTANSVERKIDVSITFNYNAAPDTYRLIAEDSCGLQAALTLIGPFTKAQNPELAASNLTAALHKSGSTIFNVQYVDIQASEIPFFKASELNAMRRELLESLRMRRVEHYRSHYLPAVVPQPFANNTSATNETVLDYRANIANHLAREFYTRHGFTVSQMALEVECPVSTSPSCKPSAPAIPAKRELMRTPYCLRREIGCCLRRKTFPGMPTLPKLKISDHERLFLENNGSRFELLFDCARCEMAVLSV